MTLLISYIFLGLSIAAPVGPINIEIIKRGLSYGFWPSFCVGLGGMSSDLLLMSMMFLGLSYFLTILWVKILLMLFGCVILLQSGWTSLHVSDHYQHQGMERSSAAHPKFGSYAKGFLIAGTNPMNLLFWISIYGSILGAAFEKANLLHSFLLSTLVFVGIALWNLNLALTIHFSKTFLQPRFIKWIHLTASLVLIGFGLHFGYKGITLGLKALL
ncbi:LysE family transporter [Halobacillus rhizosphaerae]|uniref:LysE family translocator n=1 Tax=Halobacillus rhizosphaerae TaxID=3064889 RepID=UPI00398B7774